jgi:transcriptional regulator with XRE-family HTH domain
MSLAANIKKYRELRKYSVQDLADKMNIGKAGIYKWEAGETKPGQESLTALAKALDCSVSELLGENPTSVQETGDNKDLPAVGDVYRNIVEGNTEYILIPRAVLAERYRLVSIEQFEKDKMQMEEDSKELERRDKQIADLHSIIKTMVMGGVSTPTKSPKVKEG